MIKEALGVASTIEEAQKIIDDFYGGFPKVKEWTDKTQSDAKQTDYVEDLWGRRRRLNDLLLPKYKITQLGSICFTLELFPALDNPCKNTGISLSTVALKISSSLTGS
jgi:hypothetical protein